MGVTLSFGTLAVDNFNFKEAEELTPLEDQSAHNTRVHAHIDQWQSSGVFLEQGNRYLVTADGQWQIGGLCNPTGPDGVSPYTVACWDGGPLTRVVPDATHAALIAKTGRSGKAYAVGHMQEFTAKSSGILYFMINDAPGWFADNTGTLDIRIKLITGSAAASATTRITSTQE